MYSEDGFAEEYFTSVSESNCMTFVGTVKVIEVEK
jgi:hypothetical protein